MKDQRTSTLEGFDQGKGKERRQAFPELYGQNKLAERPRSVRRPPDPQVRTI
ncbi:hypothetical protein LOAG_04680 [Loa loa]|uniref:Uncharacterized protein n=1 Tax=Loa loa TaxID=7209 RepID=A0A1S0U1W5_LOALO|nr:hypothetical protein LOAG_04680 [Loa loa]EFO23804.1 hypothetical protein LOAG_04680 [Loa loa]